MRNQNLDNGTQLRTEGALLKGTGDEQHRKRCPDTRAPELV
jgi:hypothetical protein